MKNKYLFEFFPEMFFYLHFMQLFSYNVFQTCLTFFSLSKHEKTTLKVGHNRPRLFFSVLPTGPNPTQILIPVP